jgi:hypothetical protein
MSKSINDLIRAALGDAEAADAAIAEPVGIQKTAAAAPARPGPSEHEKLASALEFIGRKGVSSFVEKKASHMGDGNVGTTAKSPPGGGETQKTLGNMGTGTSHPALASNQAAIDADKKIKGKHEAPQLKAVLDNAKDANIHKAASHDPALVKAALAKKIAESHHA